MARPIAPSVAPGDDFDPDGHVPVGMKLSRSGALKRRNIIWRVRRFLVAFVAVSVLGTSAVAAQFWNSVTVPSAPEPPESSLLCDAKVDVCTRGSAFAEFGKAESAGNVTFDEIPPVLIYALIAAEDKDFLIHQGVDPTGIARALWTDLRSAGSAGLQGGSTVTQQLIKNISNDDSLTLRRKITEAVQAMKLERETSKQDILTRYFNEIYLGRWAQGLRAAVRAYFGPGVEVRHLDLPKAAYLAALIREPEFVDANRSVNDPCQCRDKQRTYATERRADVVRAMAEQGYITAAERDEVIGMGWDYVIERPTEQADSIFKHREIGATQWRTYIRNWIKNNVPEVSDGALESSGLRVYTSMDPVLQQQATDAVKSTLPTADEKLETALASYDENGFLRAMVPGRHPETVEYNHASTALRQPGSSFKPVVMAQYLLSNGKRLTDRFKNERTWAARGDKDCKLIEGEETPEPITVEDAMVTSSNTVFCQMQDSISNVDTINLAKALGLRDDNFDQKLNPTQSYFLGIGQPVKVSAVQMASMFSTFANGGQKIGPFPIVKITRANGTILWQARPEPKQILPTPVADQVNWSLRRVVNDDHGTAHKEVGPLSAPVAGKTGTVATDEEDDNSDAWFVGYTCNVTTAVWMGHRDDTDGIGAVEDVRKGKVNGGTLPARIFTKYMTGATRDKPPCAEWKRPPESVPATLPPTTPPATDSDRWRPWWERDREPDPEEATTTTRQRPGGPRTTDPDSSTTTRFPFPRFTTTTDPDGPGNPDRP